MPAKSLTKTEPTYAVDKQLFNAAGVLLQFLASPEEVGDAICLIRGTMPPGVVVPLHRHKDPELLYVLEGTLEVYRSSEGSAGWTVARVGDVVVVPGNVKHALRKVQLFRSPWPWSLNRSSTRFFVSLPSLLIRIYNPHHQRPKRYRSSLQSPQSNGYWLASCEEKRMSEFQLIAATLDVRHCKSPCN